MAENSTDEEAARRLAGVLFARGRTEEAWKVHASLGKLKVRTSGSGQVERRRLYDWLFLLLTCSVAHADGLQDGQEAQQPTLWLCERELGFLVGKHGRTPPRQFECTGGFKARGPGWMAGCCKDELAQDLLISHLMAMTFLDEVGAFEESLVHQGLASRLCPSRELQVRGALATPTVFSSCQAIDSHRAAVEGRLSVLRGGEALPSNGPPEAAPHLLFSPTPPTMMIGYQVRPPCPWIYLHSHSTLASAMYRSTAPRYCMRCLSHKLRLPWSGA